MKLDISAMKKENHLMEIKLNEQYGKHDDLKEEFRLSSYSFTPKYIKFNF